MFQLSLTLKFSFLAKVLAEKHKKEPVLILLVPTGNLQDFKPNPKLNLGKNESNIILDILVVFKLESNRFL